MPVNLLVAEDSLIIRKKLITHLSGKGYTFFEAEDGAQALEIYKQEDIPLVLTDWMMPNMNGLELIRNIREESDGEYAYIILLTAKDGKKEIVEGISCGADDYIVKPFNSDELAVRIRAGQRIAQLKRDLLNTHRKLELLATTDPLTGLLNRRAMMEQLEGELSRARRDQTAFCVTMLDIDHFKGVNDTYGHASGDLVLKEVSRRLSDSIRKYDIVGRIGGEEFLVVLPKAPPDVAAKLAERFRDALESNPMVLEDGTELKVTGSFGISCCGPDTFNNVDDMVNFADHALYQAKETGRNKVCTFAPDSQ